MKECHRKPLLKKMSDIVDSNCETVNIFPSNDLCEKCGGHLEEVKYAINSIEAGQMTYRCRNCGHKQVKT